MTFPPFSILVRLLLGVLLAMSAAGCAVEARSPEPPARWVVIGDRLAAPTGDVLAAVADAQNGGRPRPLLLDLSVPGADLERTLGEQLSGLAALSPDLIIVRVSGQDPATGSAGTGLPDRVAGALGRLLAGVARQTAAPVVVSTLAPPPTDPVSIAVRIMLSPPVSGSPTDGRLAIARQLRQTEQVNRAIRAAAGRYGSLVVALDGAAPAATGATAVTSVVDEPLHAWRTAFQQALGMRAPATANRSRLALRPLLSPTAPAVSSTDGISYLSGFDGPALDSLRERVALAMAVGRRPDVVAKLGDSITSSPNFLAPLAGGAAQYGRYGRLAATAAYFANTPILDSEQGFSTSLTRQSRAARNKWMAADIFSGEPSALVQEIATVQPVLALVMFGTNDLTLYSVEDFEREMDRLLRQLEGAYVIPVLSTIPNRTDRTEFDERVPDFNAAIRALAAVYGAPVIDYGGAMAQQPDGGLAPDGIHPSICPDGPGVLTDSCLRYGYNLRNLLTLEALELFRLRALPATVGRNQSVLVLGP